MFSECKGDIFDSGCDIIAIPVNLKGVMGKGLAKAFSLKYPQFVPPYKLAIENGLLAKNKPCSIQLDGKKFMMVPTKDDWRKPSSLADVAKTIQAISTMWPEISLSSKSLALPALGCGCGGLDYDKVKEIVENTFKYMEIKVELYQPL